MVRAVPAFRWLAPLALLAGCASPSLLLLPDEDGGQGAIALLDEDGNESGTIVTQGDTRTRLSGARPTPRAARPTTSERALLGGIPSPPASFILYFQEGTTVLAPNSAPQLDALRAEVARRPGAEVDVTGYTDTVGSEEDNDRLSERRAEEIVMFLAAQGLSRDVMTAIGRGERDLQVRTADEVANAENRRVEIVVR